MNLHKSKTATFDMINEPDGPDGISSQYDIICIQEPWTDRLGNARHNSRWDIIYPTSRLALGNNSLLRSIILVNRKLSSNGWRQIEVLETNDITTIQLFGAFGRLTIFNIYNDGTHS
ncbi:hypothetical protein BT96DRAFT_817538 [Gymnopus androsaceus JB14]|uniref:Endonuclease/exonuclease/phosphatase domain-containing protein n=1 Tax=Gymnopus androsaceus JB14 TaxID=1447944 RepID=A0A6A4HYR7_9AGAR|nr:hypothetical protein BT96DRAFT_817538 [Gymnopus androsaceus JB14]